MFVLFSDALLYATIIKSWRKKNDSLNCWRNAFYARPYVDIERKVNEEKRTCVFMKSKKKERRENISTVRNSVDEGTESSGIVVGKSPINWWTCLTEFIRHAENLPEPTKSWSAPSNLVLWLRHWMYSILASERATEHTIGQWSKYSLQFE